MHSVIIEFGAHNKQRKNKNVQLATKNQLFNIVNKKQIGFNCTKKIIRHSSSKNNMVLLAVRIESNSGELLKNWCNKTIRDGWSFVAPGGLHYELQGIQHEHVRPTRVDSWYKRIIRFFTGSSD